MKKSEKIKQGKHLVEINNGRKNLVQKTKVGRNSMEYNMICFDDWKNSQRVAVEPLTPDEFDKIPGIEIIINKKNRKAT